MCVTLCLCECVCSCVLVSASNLMPSVKSLMVGIIGICEQADVGADIQTPGLMIEQQPFCHWTISPAHTYLSL